MGHGDDSIPKVVNYQNQEITDLKIDERNVILEGTETKQHEP